MLVSFMKKNNKAKIQANDGANKLWELLNTKINRKEYNTPPIISPILSKK